ncbi:hypothetical protein SteCoe_22542 [Stentor coeruleus]|uniref:NPHP4 Ig-like domain-containing protein n=1 Tax=Stentor coeruleus TaxID=5963 RepID=A0A1R2BLZ5_9CILI|nr:hypothetical protein SteCoe_22542 [Stentor coeruleus]
MIRTELEKVVIEHCIGCKTHQWCTNHDESKYIQYFTACKNGIDKSCLGVTVAENEIPLGFQRKFVTDPNTSQFGKYHFPRIGSFEVYFRGKLIFSKIETMKWPHPGIIVEKIKEIQHAPQKTQARKKVSKGKRVKSNLPFKRKKAKKGRKKIIKTAIKDEYFLPSIDVNDRPITRDQPARGVKNRLIELPKYSVDMDQSLEHEKPIHQDLGIENNRVIENSDKHKEEYKQKDPITKENKPQDLVFIDKKPTPDIKADGGKDKNYSPVDNIVKNQNLDLKEKKSFEEIVKNDNNKEAYMSSSESESDHYGSSDNSVKGFGENEENVDYMEIMKKYPENFEKDPELEGFVKRTMEAQAKSRERLKEKSVQSEDYDKSSEHSKGNYENHKFLNQSDEDYTDEDKNIHEEKKNSDKEDENYSDEDYEDDKKSKKSDNEEYSNEDYEDDKKLKKSEHENYSSEDYEDEKIVVKNQEDEEEYNSEDYQEKKSEKNDEEYSNEDYEDNEKSHGSHDEDNEKSQGSHDEDNEKSHGSHDEDNEKSHGSHDEDNEKSHGSHDEDYGKSHGSHDEDYENSDKSHDQAYEDDENSDKSHDQTYKDDENSDKNSKQSRNKSSKSSKKDDYNESDFEDDQGQHPLRPVDKSYNVQLPLNEECKKKITYQNIGDNAATFFIESSDPDYMSIKETEIYIEKGKKEKIQLRFAPMVSNDEKKFYLYIDRNGEPWECIEIVTEYTE